jgi:hypothetical protein
MWMGLGRLQFNTKNDQVEVDSSLSHSMHLTILRVQKL